MVGRAWPRETVRSTGGDQSVAPRCRWIRRPGDRGGGRTGVRSNQHHQGRVPLDEDVVPFAATVTADARPVVVNSPRRCRMISSLIDDDTPRKKNQQRFAGSTAATAIPTLVTDYSSSCRLCRGQRRGHLHDYVVSINHGHVNDVRCGVMSISAAAPAESTTAPPSAIEKTTRHVFCRGGLCTVRKRLLALIRTGGAQENGFLH